MLRPSDPTYVQDLEDLVLRLIPWVLTDEELNFLRGVTINPAPKWRLWNRKPDTRIGEPMAKRSRLNLAINKFKGGNAARIWILLQADPEFVVRLQSYIDRRVGELHN